MPGLFSSATLEQIRAASDIVDVIGSYIPLKRAGANFVALCPFHKEKTPSFNVNPHRQIFHCFGCHKGGDVFTFVKEYENLDFVEAVKRLADRARIPLEYERGEAGQQTRHLKDTLLQIHEQIAQRWHNCLLNEAAGQAAREYLKKRGVSDEAIKLFRIGAAPESWDDTVNWAKGRGYDLETAEKAGLIIRKLNAPASDAVVDAPTTAATEADASPAATDAARGPQIRNYYDRFRGRLMFPICDEQGRVIGFSGRVLAGDEKTAKYVNSPETPIFTKSKVFFGLDKSKRAILDAGFAIICEGQLDLIACFMAGVQNIVAPQGTAFTADHARILKRYVDEVVLCFDSDEAGQNAAVRSLDHLLESGLAVRVVVVPAPHDPDSLIRERGGIAFKNLVHGADGFFDYYLNRLCATNEAATDKGRNSIVRAMADAVLKTGNSVLIDKYAQKTALRLGVSSDSVRAEFLKQRGAMKASPAENSAPDDMLRSGSPSLPSPQESWLLKLLFLIEETAPWCAAHVDVNWIQHPLAREIVSRRVDAHRAGQWTSLAAFLDDCGSAEMRGLITEAATAERAVPSPMQQMADVSTKLRNQSIDREIMSLIQKSNQPETDETERVQILRRIQQLRDVKRRPLGIPS